MEQEMALKLVELISKLEEEEILWIKGKPFFIRPASTADVEQVSKGFMCMD